MNKIIDKLSKQFLPENRFDNFGPIILELDISGIKGTNCIISFDFPVTSIAGINGAGKSTIAQIALCMYRAAEGKNGNERKYLKDFFVKTLLDKSPYLPDAHIKVRYAVEIGHSNEEQTSLFIIQDALDNTKTIDVHYAGDRWAGYKHQPQRAVYYYGMSYFIPYQELNSNLLRDSNASVTNTNRFDDSIVKTVADILSIKYTNLLSNNISNDKRTENVISANKRNASYSENHMGCGEGRLLKLIYALENAPMQSLFVIEEPETALHQSAQYKLAEYFLDVCERKKHQIIFTTHSSEIQRALPSQARKYIEREEDGNTTVVNSPSIAQISNYLSGGHEKKMIIVTEDEIGMLYCKEILRAYCPSVFNNCQFFSMNLGYIDLKRYVEQSQKCGIKIFGVVDEHRREDINNCILAFPNEQSPEVSMFSNDSLRERIKSEFHFDCSNLPDDPHDYFDSIAKSKNEDEKYVKNRCIKIFVQIKGRDYFKEIIDSMSRWLSECNS
jgi:predicted ATPase